MPRPSVAVVAVLLLLQQQGRPGAAFSYPSYRAPRHQQPAVYDVEVREVDSETLRQLLAGQRGQGNNFQQGQGSNFQGQGHYPPSSGTTPYGPGQWYQRPPPQQPGGATGGGSQTKAHFVSPSGQVYSLKVMNGEQVLVGPDGRWYPLNGAGAGGHVTPGTADGGHHQHQGDDDLDDNGYTSPTTRGPTRHPPGPSGPSGPANSFDDEGPSYDRKGNGDGAKPIRAAEDCVASQTTYNGGRKACRLQLLLDEHFDVFNLTLWKHDVLMPDEPDFEFVAYDKDPDNSYVDKSILHIKPTLLEDAYGAGFVMNGTLTLADCTSPKAEECSRTATTYRVLPAVRSARLTTRDAFSFKYGIVEARVLVPDGDWIYPAVTLEAATPAYGKWYAGGQIRLPYASGNRFLARRADGPRTGLQVMRAGVALGKAAGQDIRPTLLEKEVRASNGSNWRRKHFRVHRVKWTPEYIEFSLDGKVMYTVRPPPGGFVSMTDSPGDHPWRTGSAMAPFDEEFFLSLGVGVGGVNRFPDGGVNGEYNEHPKPWKNSSPKALLDFYKARDHWFPTWANPALEIAHIKVWAL